MNEIIKFDFNGNQVRVVMVGGREEWVARDVCESLELDSTSGHVLDHLDDDEKDRRTVPTLGGPQEMATVTESGLYSLKDGEELARARWVASPSEQIPLAGVGG